MEREPMNRLIRSLHKWAGPNEGDRLGDEELLQRFVAGRDQAAFELLLWRHGPMVLGVCRRLLPDPHDAEDAFQATWLTFVKKAGSVVHGGAVGSWLYQVAHRVALRARIELAKRAKKERHAPNEIAAAPADEPVGSSELGQVLDEELSRLPDRQRAAFVLCCLEGRTGEEAARELGCPAGTVSSRLTRARERLRTRLIRRGLAPAASALSAALAGEGFALSLSENLAASTLKAAHLFSSGEAAGEELSRQAVLLAEGVLRSMLLTKVKIAALLLLTFGVLTAGGVLTHHALTAAPPEKEAAKAERAAPAPAARKVPKELLEKRLEAAQNVYKQTLQRIRGGQGLPAELFGWSERWFEAETALSDKKAEHIKAFKAHVERTREVERLMIGWARAGQGKQADAEAATYYRVTAEIQFFEATGELLPNSPEKKLGPKGPAGKDVEELGKIEEIKR
jgi:RNA polymerase sigma factor (sigma-70 family)